MTELIIKYAEPKAGEADSVVRPMEVMGELVRCKDCKYYNKGENERESWEECNRTMKSTSADDFCSWAKMKGGNE